jgi:hypothetical protein
MFWIRQAAERRLSDIEINSFVFLINLTEHPATVAEHIANRLLGTKEEIWNDLIKRRSEYGISYITIPFSHAEGFAPIVAHLTNQ